MKGKFFALVLLMVLTSLVQASVRDAAQLERDGKLREAFDAYVRAFQAAPTDSHKSAELRTKIIEIALKLDSAPEVPEEAKKRVVFAMTALEEQNASGDKDAIEEFIKVSRIAPWWPLAYYNLGLLHEKQGNLKAAVENLQFYLIAAPSANDAAAVKTQLYKLEYKLSKNERLAEANKPPAIVRHSPSNPGLVFSEFLKNRVQAKLTVRRSGLFSPVVAEKDMHAVLVSDGNRVYALMHISDTPFVLSEEPKDYEQITYRLMRGSVKGPGAELNFLQLDPRLIVAPVDEIFVSFLDARVYLLEKEPFKYPDAVLMRIDDGRYGNIPFRVDPTNGGYVKLDGRVVTRQSGEIAPKRGDLVFSKAGDLIGLMVNSDYCAVLANLEAANVLKLGDDPEPNTSVILSELQSRWQRLPVKLQ